MLWLPCTFRVIPLYIISQMRSRDTAEDVGDFEEVKLKDVHIDQPSEVCICTEQTLLHYSKHLKCMIIG